MPSSPIDPPTQPPEADQATPAIMVNIEDEMRASYLDYAMSVIIGRALPDVRDGLKPVHRRVLYAMHELGNGYNRAYKKSARIVGDVIGKFHPHGDQGVYDTLVRLAQDFSMRHVLVDGQGNFGSIDGDPPAAMRYTEVRMSKLASEMLADIDKDTVDFGPNYDDSLREPLVLPTKLPQLLVNGSSGIAVGMATNIPPHNLKEVVSAAIALAQNDNLTTEELMAYVPGPDFPTGGMVYGTDGLQSAYLTGRGVVQVRGRAAVESHKNRERIVITEIPFQVNKSALLEKIADLVRDKRIEGISDLRDESNRHGMRVVIELKAQASSELVLNQLYSHTSLQISFGYNMLAIVRGKPQLLSLRDILRHFVHHRREVVTRRSLFELRKAREQFNVAMGLILATDAIDQVIKLIRQSKDGQTAKTALMQLPLLPSQALQARCQPLLIVDFPQKQQLAMHAACYLSDTQAQAILDMRLGKLTSLENEKLLETATQLTTQIAYLTKILNDDNFLLGVVVEELTALREQYQSPRRTELIGATKSLRAEDLIAEEMVVVTLSHLGYVKRNPIALYQSQNRGGRGKTATSTREEDFVKDLFVASSHAYVLIFTNKGKVYWLKVHEIPQASRTSRGKPLVNLIRIDSDETISAVLPVNRFEEGHFVVMVTEKGTIKKTDLMAFANPRPSGLIALSIDADDRLINADLTDGQRDIVLGTRSGLLIRFAESQVRPMGRSARGVRAITLKKANDVVVGMVVVADDTPQLLTVCGKGYGKRTNMQEFRCQSRGGSGIINCRTSYRNGDVVTVVGINPNDEIMLVTDAGMMMRTMASQISQQSREASGVRVMATNQQERVASVARIRENLEETLTPEA